MSCLRQNLFQWPDSEHVCFSLALTNFALTYWPYQLMGRHIGQRHPSGCPILYVREVDIFIPRCIIFMQKSWPSDKSMFVCCSCGLCIRTMGRMVSLRSNMRLQQHTGTDTWYSQSTSTWWRALSTSSRTSHLYASSMSRHRNSTYFFHDIPSKQIVIFIDLILGIR